MKLSTPLPIPTASKASVDCLTALAAVADELADEIEALADANEDTIDRVMR